MKGFAILTVAVLVVIGVGVGVVGGLPSAAQKYSLNGIWFSVAFPARLTPEPTLLSPCSEGDGGMAEGAHLALVVEALGPTGKTSPTPTDGIPSAAVSAHCVTVVGVGPLTPCSSTLGDNPFLGVPLHLTPGEYCTSFTVRQVGSVTLLVSATSTKGLGAAEAVVRSFKVLGSRSP
ncbi:MAG: hypothetical protein WAL04_04095 [Acidimicrobiales bacterium]